MDKIQLAYTAGIMDGEGSIGLYKCIAKTCVRGYRYRVGIYITNTNLGLMKLLKSWFGGTIETLKNRFPQRKQIYRWTMNGVSDQLNFLRLIEPYLTIKRSQAKLAIKFFEGGGIGYHGVVTDTEWGRRDDLYQIAKTLNSRGVEPQRLSVMTGNVPDAIVQTTAN